MGLLFARHGLSERPARDVVRTNRGPQSMVPKRTFWLGLCAVWLIGGSMTWSLANHMFFSKPDQPQRRVTASTHAPKDPTTDSTPIPNNPPARNKITSNDLTSNSDLIPGNPTPSNKPISDSPMPSNNPILNNPSLGTTISASRLEGMTEIDCWRLVLKNSDLLPRSRLTPELQQVVLAADAQFNKTKQQRRFAEFAGGRRFLDWGQGFTFQKDRFAVLLMLAEESKATGIGFYFDSAVYDSSIPIAPEHIFDLAYINLQYAPSYVIMPVTPPLPDEMMQLPPPNEIKAQIQFSAADVLVLRASSGHRSQYRKAKQSLRPAAWIADEVDFYRAKLAQYHETAMDYVCLHLRTEADFLEFMKHPPKYYSLELTLEKLRRSSVALGFKDRNLYVAGNHAEDTIARIRAAGIFKAVYTKDMLLPAVHPFRSKANELPRTLGAIFEAEMCRGCSLFIGNCYSTWSEDIHDSLIHRLNTTTVQSQIGGKTLSEQAGSWMVNDHNLGVSPLLPFCSNHQYDRHGEKCEYPVVQNPS